MSKKRTQHLAGPKRPHARVSLALRLGLPALALAWAGASAQPAPADLDSHGLYCLGEQGAATDAVGRLRLAGVPVDQGSPLVYLQGMVSHLTGNALPSAASMPGGVPAMAKAYFAAPPPLVKLLFDGSADLQAGRHADAQRQLLACAGLAHQQGDPASEGACRNNLGVTYAATGRYKEARTELEAALSLYETPRVRTAARGASAPLDRPLDPMAALLRGMAKLLTPEQRAQMEASTREQQAKLDARMNTLAMRRGTELVSLNLANLALVGGRLADAQRHAQHAFDSHAPEDSASCRAAAATDLARIAARLPERRAEAQRLLATYRFVHDPDNRSVSLVELGSLALAGASPGEQSAMTTTPLPAGSVQRSGTPTLSLGDSLNEPTDRIGDVALTQAFAQAAGSGGAPMPPARALADWQRLALRADAGQRPDLAFSARAALMRLHVQRGEAAQAIYEGKRAANLAQAARANLGDATPSRDARRAFLRERRQVVAALAQALLDERRLQEAESVLQLLKEDEGQQFIDRPGAASLLALTVGEQARQRQDDDFARQLQQAERARVAAAENPVLGGGALRAMSRPQLEAAVLKQALGVDRLPAQLRAKPFQSPGTDPASQAIVRETQALLGGPSPRLEQFMRHVVEDAPQFDPPPGAAERAHLADTLARLPRIQAELQPLVATPTRAPAFGFRMSGPGKSKSREEEGSPSGLFGAEIMERLWRTLRAADEIEAVQARHADDAIATVPGIAPAPDDTVALMARQRVPTDLLYYLSGDDRLDILLVSAAGRRHVRIAQSRAELDAGVASFVKALKDSDSDPLPAAQAMYRRLFAPIAPAVRESGARLLAFSFEGALRFMPPAALHDGSHWLVEDYAIALHPGGTLAGRLKPASDNWRAAAFGATLGGRVGGLSFGALPYVRGEIGAVVHDKDNPRGALPGKPWLNADFTAQRLRSALADGAPVLHIASHFAFAKGDADHSWLLLGDGGALSLRDLASPVYRFDRTELVTLSACETGVSSEDGYDQEVDGLAALLMGQGAPSVLASLWQVSDASTATLMASLYRQHETQHASRAQSLQRAQQAMILAAAPRPATAEGGGPSRTVSPIGAPPAQDAGTPATSLGYGHPYFWAPFVLMGDWL